jgi:hypothetical protein
MKVGDYVRTKYGIAKIIDLKENPYGEKTIYILNKSIINIYDCEGSELACCNPFVEDIQDRFDTKFGDEKCIIKSSPNIIDLIEEGDILKVNDFKDVYTIYEVEMFRNPYTNEKYLGIRNDIGKRPKRLYEIPLVNLSIVTHEQFSQMKYKVGEQ